MKRTFLTSFCVMLLFIAAKATDTTRPRRLAYEVALEMQDNYDGWFRKHTKTDGIIIEADRLAQLAQRFSGKKLGLIYGRRLQKEEDYGHRVTLILVVYTPASPGSAARVAPDQHEYYDLGEESLCPPPRMCDTYEIEE